MKYGRRLKELLKETGINDYSIFLDETTNDLFGVLKVENAECIGFVCLQSSDAKMVGIHERY